MALNLDKAFAPFAQALVLRSQRAGVLASNLANADTPGYQARDFDFTAALDRATGAGAGGVEMARTAAGHMGTDEVVVAGERMSLDLGYRVPTQPAVDGNTVESHVEKAAYMENSLRYQASLTFLDARIKSLRAAMARE